MSLPDDFPALADDALAPPSPLAMSVIGRPLNGVEGYAHGAHARAYLRARAASAGVQVDDPEPDAAMTRAVMAMTGYPPASWPEFCEHLVGWHGLWRPIPRGYADFLGVTEADLRTAVARDLLAFRRACKGPFRLRTFSLRRMANVYVLRAFPPNCVDDQVACLTYLFDLCADTGRRICLHVPNIKTLWFEPPFGIFDVDWHRPAVKVTATEITFADAGLHEGERRRL